MKKVLKKITGILLCIMVLFTITSCDSLSTAQLSENGTASFYSKASVSKTEVDEFIENVKLNKVSDETLEEYGLTRDNIQEEIDEIVSGAKTEVVGRETYYYYEVNESFKTVKEMSEYFKAHADGESLSVTLNFNNTNISSKEAWFNASPNYYIKNIVTKNIFKVTMPYKIVKTNGEIENEYTAKFDLQKLGNILYVVTDKSTAGWGKSNNIENAIAEELKQINKPEKVIGIKVFYKNNSSLCVHWNMATVMYDHNYVGYELYRKKNSGEWKKIKLINKNTVNSFIDKNISANKTYSYKVRAFSVADEGTSYGQFSSSAGIKTVNFKIKPIIKNVTAKKNSVSVKLKKRITNTSGYQVQCGLNKKFKSAKKGKSTKIIIKVSGLKSNKKYYVRVRVYKYSGGKYVYGAWSNVKKVTTK